MFYISIGLLGLSIFISLIGQDHIVDSLLKGKDIYKISKVLKINQSDFYAVFGFRCWLHIIRNNFKPHKIITGQIIIYLLM